MKNYKYDARLKYSLAAVLPAVDERQWGPRHR